MFIESHISTEDHLVLLHGTPQDPADMARLADRVKERVSTHVVHLPGYGKSPAAALPYSLDAVAAELEAQLAERGVERAFVVGMSGGCYRAFSLYTRGNLEVRGIYGIGPLAHVDEATAAALNGFADALDAGIDVGAAGAARVFSPAYLEAHPELVQVVTDLFAAVPHDMMSSELRAFARSDDLRPGLAGLNVPVVLRVGELDVATPPQQASDLLELIEGAQLERVAGAGHMLTYEDLDGTAASLLAFLG